MARETESLVRELVPGDGSAQAELFGEIEVLVARAEVLYGKVWRLHGGPSNDESPLLRNVEHRLSHALLDEYTKWIRRPAETD